MSPQKIVMSKHCQKQFDKKTDSFVDYNIEDFTEKINTLYSDSSNILKDGYAPFCKHIFVENFTTLSAAFIKITKENEKFIKSFQLIKNIL